MKNNIFFTWTLSFHLQTDWRKRIITFTDGGKATPFHPSLGFGPFRHTLLGVEGGFIQATFDEKLIYF